MEKLSEAISEQVRVQLDWSAASAAPGLHVNQALGNIGSPGSDGLPDGIYLTMGSVTPPAILGDDEARARTIEKLSAQGVTVNVVGQFHMSRQMLGDLIAVLQSTAVKYDAAVQMATERRQSAQGGDTA